MRIQIEFFDPYGTPRRVLLPRGFSFTPTPGDTIQALVPFELWRFAAENANPQATSPDTAGGLHHADGLAPCDAVVSYHADHTIDPQVLDAAEVVNHTIIQACKDRKEWWDAGRPDPRADIETGRPAEATPAHPVPPTVNDQEAF